jgi:hypothetical protein
MKKTVFISYDFKDATYKGEVEKWLKEMGINVKVQSLKELNPQSDEAAKKDILHQMEGIDHLLVLVGDNTHNRPWVDYEVSVARSRSISVTAVQLAQRTGAPPKEIRGIPCIDYSEQAIKSIKF